MPERPAPKRRPKGDPAPAFARDPPVDFTAAIAAQAMPIATAIRSFAAQADLDEIRRVENERAATIQRLKEEERRLRGEDPATKVIQWFDQRSGTYFHLRHDEPRDGPGFQAWARAEMGFTGNTERSPNPVHDYPAWFAEARPRITDAQRTRLKECFGERLRLSIDPTREAASTVIAQRGLLAALLSGAVVAYGRQSGTTTKRLISRETWSGDWTLATSDSSARRATPEARFDDLSFVEAASAATLGNHGAGRKPDSHWPFTRFAVLVRLQGEGRFATANEVCDLVSPDRQVKPSTVRDHFVGHFGRFGWRSLFDDSPKDLRPESGLGYWPKLDGAFLLSVRLGTRPKVKSDVLKAYIAAAKELRLSPPNEVELMDHLVDFWTPNIWAKFPDGDQA